MIVKMIYDFTITMNHINHKNQRSIVNGIVARYPHCTLGKVAYKLADLYLVCRLTIC